jgi:hypothetical protein
MRAADSRTKCHARGHARAFWGSRSCRCWRGPQARQAGPLTPPSRLLPRHTRKVMRDAASHTKCHARGHARGYARAIWASRSCRCWRGPEARQAGPPTPTRQIMAQTHSKSHARRRLLHEMSCARLFLIFSSCLQRGRILLVSYDFSYPLISYDFLGIGKPHSGDHVATKVPQPPESSAKSCAVHARPRFWSISGGGFF